MRRPLIEGIEVVSGVGTVADEEGGHGSVAGLPTAVLVS